MNDQVTPEPQCDPDNLASTGVLAELESAMRESDATLLESPDRGAGEPPAQAPTDPAHVESLRQQVLDLQRENRELSGQAQAMFEAMDKKGRANWLKRDERIRELTALSDQQERTIRELRENPPGAAAIDGGSRSSEEIANLRGRLDQAERDRDEALALRDKAEQNAVELFDSLSGEARASWMDRDELKNQLDELRASYEGKIAELRRQPPPDLADAPARPHDDEEAGRLRAAVEELSAHGRSLAEELGRRDEECASLRRECERLTAEADRPAPAPIAIPDGKSSPAEELEYLRTVASELVERHEENRIRIEELQRKNAELAQAAEAKDGAAAQVATTSPPNEPLESEIEGLFAALQQRETLLDELQNRLEDAERRASDAGANDPELVSVLYERLAQAEARERELIGQLEGGISGPREQFQHLQGARKDLADRLGALEGVLLAGGDGSSGFAPSLDLDDEPADQGASPDDLGHQYQRLGRLVDACERQSQLIAGGGSPLKAEIDRLTAQLQERDLLLDELQGHFEQIIASTEGGALPAAEGQNDHLQAKVNGMIEREQELRLDIAQQADENQKLRLEVDRMCQQVAEGALRNQELVHLRQVIGEFAGREQYIEELELRLEGYESGGGAPSPGGDSHREENRLLRAQVEQLSREMESISELHEAVKDLESVRMQSIRLQDQLHAREIEVNGLEAELEKTQAERDREIQSLRIELAKAEASRARDRLDSSGVVDLWSTRGTSAGGTTNGTQFSAPQRTATTTVSEDEGPTSIDERIRAFRQHLDSLEHTRPGGAPGNGKRKGGGGFFSRIFGRKR